MSTSRKVPTLALRRQLGDKKLFVSFKPIPPKIGLKTMQEAVSKLLSGMTEADCKD